jgi:hypothetical protein
VTDKGRNNRQCKPGGIPGHVPEEQPVIFSGIRSMEVFGTELSDPYQALLIIVTLLALIFFRGSQTSLDQGQIKLS